MANPTNSVLEYIVRSSIIELVRMLKNNDDNCLFPNENFMFSYEWPDGYMYRETERYLKRLMIDINTELCNSGSMDYLESGNYTRFKYVNQHLLVS